MRLIDANALMDYCNNLKDKTIDANDIARFPTAVGWISVKDRLPKEPTREEGFEHEYLAIVNGHAGNITYEDAYLIATYVKGEEWAFYDIDDPEPDLKVSYWMPLPEPPEEVPHVPH